MSVKNLTQKTVNAERWTGKTRFIRDAGVRGLILAVNKTSKTWKVQRDMWRDKRVKTIRHTLGSTDDLTLKQARALAQEVIGQIRRGINPNEPAPEAPASPLTVGELWDQYEARLIRRESAEVTIRSFRYHLDKYLADWRDKPISELRKSLCRERHEELTARHGKYPANQVMRSLRAAYNYAIRMDDDDVLRSNPVGGRCPTHHWRSRAPRTARSAKAGLSPATLYYKRKAPVTLWIHSRTISAPVLMKDRSSRCISRRTTIIGCIYPHQVP